MVLYRSCTQGFQASCSHGAPQAFYDVGRQAWGHGPVGEPPKVTGLDVVTVRDGRIVVLYAFIDTPVT